MAKAKKLYALLSKQPNFIDLAEIIIDNVCPIKDCPAKKYTNRDYLMAILKVFEKYTYWCSYEGDIKWKTLNAKFNQWNRLNIFGILHKEMLTKYLKTSPCKKLKYQMIDSTSIPNKQGVELANFNGTKFKGKQSIKVSSISTGSGIPLGIEIIDGKRNDVTTIKETLDSIPIELNNEDYINVNRFKRYMLGDAGYCSKANRALLKKEGYVPYIWYNKRAEQDEKKINKHKFNKKQMKIYRKRAIIESMFS